MLVGRLRFFRHVKYKDTAVWIWH